MRWAAACPPAQPEHCPAHRPPPHPRPSPRPRAQAQTNAGKSEELEAVVDENDDL
jgi:hypothetical protein